MGASSSSRGSRKDYEDTPFSQSQPIRHLTVTFLLHGHKALPHPLVANAQHDTG
ncbi:UNVERIFIED_CONTAM: hypothetical protein Slati_1718700 [Sesamum latifolium]|uniref:Uncharacterized protein n=1 Tax=Sesamum latifolium TaxID=2727402 RepID=A0AAW2WWS9_9LAMI